MCCSMELTFFCFSIAEYAGHATAIVKSLQLEDWYGIVIVSGDGLVFEVGAISITRYHNRD